MQRFGGLLTKMTKKFEKKVWKYTYESISKDFKEEPECLQKHIDNYFKEDIKSMFSEILKKIESLSFTRVLFIGNTFSHFASYVPLYTLMQSSQKAKFCWDAFEMSEFYDYILPREPDDATLYIFMSKSGNSRVLKKALEHLRILKINPDLVWLLTNNPDVELAQSCGVVFPTFVEDEIVLGTRSYQCTILVLYLVSNLLLGENPLNDEMYNNLTEFVNEMIKFRETQLDDVVEKIYNFFGSDFDFMYLISRDLASQSAAMLSALNAKSFSRFYTEAISLGLFFHGAFQIIDENFNCVMLIGDYNREEDKTLLPRLVNLISDRIGKGKILLLSNNKIVSAAVKNIPQILNVSFNATIQAFSPIFEVFIMQMAFLKISKERGIL
jgi:fructoselysine-6-P-deglycase FrlB-like protein